MSQSRQKNLDTSCVTVAGFSNFQTSAAPYPVKQRLFLFVRALLAKVARLRSVSLILVPIVQAGMMIGLCRGAETVEAKGDETNTQCHHLVALTRRGLSILGLIARAVQTLDRLKLVRCQFRMVLFGRRQIGGRFEHCD